MPIPWARAFLVLTIAAIGCGGGSSGDSSVCKEVEGSYCSKACTGELWRCAYDGVEVEAISCEDGCKARVELLATLCEMGSDVDGEEARELSVCERANDDTLEDE